MSAASLILDIFMKTGTLETDSKRAEAIVKKRTQAMQKHFADMTADVKNMMAGMFAGISVSAAVGKLIAVQREFDGLNASLETITGSTVAAKKEFDWIKTFAAQTPYSINEVTQAFIALKAFGLDASEKTLRSFSNTATVLRKDLIQFIEAVADASNNNYERLQEFGIVARTMGDKVTITFQGMTKVIENNSKEIIKSLTDIGNHNFAGATEKRMNSLDGAIRNLSNSWDQFWLNISQKGIGNFMADQVRKAAEALENFNKIINLLNAQNRQNGFNQTPAASEGNWITELGQGLSEAYIVIDTAQKQAMAIAEGYGTAINALLRGNIDDYNLATKMMDEDIEKLKRDSAAALSAVQNYKTQNVPIAKYDVTYPTNKTTVGGETPEQIKAKTEAEKQRLQVEKEVKAIYDSTRTAAEKLAIELDRLNKLKEAGAISNELYQRAVKEAQDEISAPMKNDAAAIYEKTRTAAEKLAIEMDKLKKLMDAGFISPDTYQRAVTDMQKTLDEDIENIKKREEEKQKAIQESRNSLYAGLLSEEEDIQQSYERRKKAILEATEITDQERADLMTRLNQNLVKQMEEFKEKDYWKTWSESAKVNIEDVNEFLSNTAENFTQSFGNAFESMIFDAESFGDAMAELAESMARSVINALGQMAAQWVAYQLVQKLMGSSTAATAATAQTFNALSSQQMAALNAFASTAAIPLVGPAAAPAAAAAAIAATSPYVATIASLGAAAAAARASGGPVMGSTPYLVGERGAELFVPNTSGAIIPNDKLGGGGNITVNLIESAKKAGKTEERQTNGRRELDVFVADLMGDGPRSKAIQRSFGLQRRGY